MFTGIIEGQGEVLSVNLFDNQARFRIKPLFSIQDCKRGESIAINGVCLTVEDCSKDWFEVYASTETLNVTNLKSITKGKNVNLERSLMTGQRLGGHFVTGHVDSLAKVSKITQAASSRIFYLEFDKKFNDLLVAKGSVALDGVSLTVNQCGDGFFTVNIIPETLEITTLSKWTVGYQANMETDLIGKYVQRKLGYKEDSSKLNVEFLQQHGYL